MEQELLSWNVLYTLGGASLVVFYIVQHTKHIIDMFAPKWFTTKIYAVLIAFLVLFSAFSVLNGFSASGTLLCFFNAFLVAYVSGKQFDDVKTEITK